MPSKQHEDMIEKWIRNSPDQKWHVDKFTGGMAEAIADMGEGWANGEYAKGSGYMVPLPKHMEEHRVVKSRDWVVNMLKRQFSLHLPTIVPDAWAIDTEDHAVYIYEAINTSGLSPAKISRIGAWSWYLDVAAIDLTVYWQRIDTGWVERCHGCHLQHWSPDRIAPIMGKVAADAMWHTFERALSAAPTDPA